MHFRLFLFLALGALLAGCEKSPSTSKILVFSKTGGFRHPSVEAGVAALKTLGAENGYLVEVTEDSTFFTEENLRQFAAVVFLNTSGDVLDYRQQADFQRFIQAGGGFVGIHGAAATEYDWRWYGRLVGAYFSDHPAIQKATMKVEDPSHPAVAHLPAEWSLMEEWYNFRPVPPTDKVLANVSPTLANRKDTLARSVYNVPVSARLMPEPLKPFLSPEVKVLLSVEEKSYEGGKHGASHPIAWQQPFEGGRSFYTALGHEPALFSNPDFLKHLLGGLQFAIGEGTLDYSKATTQRVPPEDRFVRTTLAENLDEPMELDIFPDGRIILVERKGAIKMYFPDRDTLETVCYLPVYKEFEEGIMGVQLDPDWQENKWIYLYYSLNEGGRRNRLSRFVFDENMLHIASEKILLEVPELVGCCHTGGSIEFDSKGNLYLSTGDNTNPFESDGFAPIDGRPGRALWDARKSSANTNDLRGKILRITPQPDGTYTIPDGNLFPQGMPNTRPEIFVMGCRNPFRISVDSKTDVVYWGDVGPDAGKDGPKRGPKGYDTVNRAARPGFYGWPLFRGNHIYHQYDFTAKQSGALFDPLRPVNNSAFNTGLKELPPVQSPLIWYSYDDSVEFPWVGTGGKNPMAGPVFHAADFSPQSVAGSWQFAIFPDYFENKLFIYEWMRNWIFVVTMDEAGRFVQADPFLPKEKFSRPMDMAFGPDGALYLLEYGTQWFAQNPDARLTKIEYAPGNRRPIARAEASPSVGAAPLSIRFSAGETVDYDKDPLQYQWTLAGTGVVSKEAAFTYTFKSPGTYTMLLKVTDTHGASSRVNKEVVVGNTPPEVTWQLDGNRTFYWDSTTVGYRLSVSDREDGNLEKGNLDPRRVRLSIDYLAQGQDVAAIVMGHQTQTSAGSLQFATGKVLIDQNDCKTCHAEDKKVNGPSYIDIANRYYGSEFAVQSLSDKVMKGGAGNWGETAMSAHPNLTRKEAEDIVKYILSMAGEVQSGAALPFEGKYVAAAHLGKEESGAYVFQASYRDKGSNGAPSLSAKETLVLRSPKMEAERYDKAAKGVRRLRLPDADTTVVTDLVDGRYVAFSRIDMTGVKTLRLGFLNPAELLPGSMVELRINAPNGELLGSVGLSAGMKKDPVLSLKPAAGLKEVYLVFKNDKAPGQAIGRLDWITFGNKGT
jgi:cytochrome c